MKKTKENKKNPQPFSYNTLQRYDVLKGIKNHGIDAGEVAQLEQCLPRPHNP